MHLIAWNEKDPAEIWHALSDCLHQYVQCIIPAFLEYLAEDGSAVTELGHDGAVPSSMSELMLALFHSKPRAASHCHRSARVLADQLQLTPRQRMYRGSQKQVGLCAQWVGWHHLARVRQIPATTKLTAIIYFHFILLHPIFYCWTGQLRCTSSLSDIIIIIICCGLVVFRLIRDFSFQNL